MPVIPERMSAHIPPLSLFPATPPYRGGSTTCESGREELYGPGRRGVVIALARVTGSLPNRWLYTGHPPPSDLYESSMLPPWSPCLTHTTIIRGRNDWLGTITAPGAMPTYGSATASAPGDVSRPAVSVPASHSHWSMMHVSTMMPSHATLPRGSLLAMAFPAVATGDTGTTATQNFAAHNIAAGAAKGHGGDEGSRNIRTSIFTDHRGSQLPQRLDHRSYRTISLGFLLSTLGILPGAVWANEAWGYHWNWDPKETRAPITWLTLAIHPHTRTTGGRRGTEPAIVAPLGFPTTRIRHSGVNPLGGGPHSYGWLIQ
uniref:Cytochrome c heme attachment protein n=1 Tax=Selaginella remotifolia TaxID=137170 RepID=A0A482CJA9_SELRE|nr:cytochrome c heme attachment protein [Selaginella remotifolia]QBL76304.1 cytochrome c heme attachment protein [Selaginella remotifolia]